MFKLGTRKIQRVRYSFYAALPPKWVEHWGLNRTSKVELFMDDQHNLVVKPSEENENA